MENAPIEAFANQVGGHTFALQNQGMLHQGHCILKQLQDCGRGDREVAFYTTIAEKYPEFTQWIAGFHGVKEVEENGIKGRFMALDDLTFGYNKPSVIDLKIGTKTWEEDAPKEKIERESKKYPLQRIIGFRLTGMRVYNAQTGDFDVYNKKFGYSQTEATLPSMFATFFSPIPEARRTDVIRSVISQLQPILAWFSVPGRLQFICSSVLIVFDGAGEDPKPIVRVVDFAHTRAASPPVLCLFHTLW
ncbi:hypothetical protein WA556_004304 [Blastocystis sp. ATCC 50177/Nand II]